MTGGVDLSVGPVLAMAGLVAYFALDAGYPVPVVVCWLASRSASSLGCSTGRDRRFLDLPPIIVTLATLSIVRGTALILGGPDQHLIRDQPAYSFIGAGSLFWHSVSGRDLRRRGAAA